MFKTNVKREPLRLTYAAFNPIDGDSAKEAVEFINNYVFEFGGIEILTDFDGQKRRLVSKSTLADTGNFKLQHRRIISTIKAWVQKETSN
jgi:hypothetical protein